MIHASYPHCHARIGVSPPAEISQQLVCRLCGTQAEVVWLYP
jgi:hypothetical protein